VHPLVLKNTGIPYNPTTTNELPPGIDFCGRNHLVGYCGHESEYMGPKKRHFVKILAR
jgi:hypothetical protein